MISRWIVLSGLLVGATACVVDIGGPEKVPRIRIVADISRTDTITAGPSNRITIEISDSTGRRRDQVTVNISGTPAGTPDGDFGMYVSNENGEPTGSINLVSDGQVSFQVFFGRRAILAPIVISVPDLGLADTLWFTVKPGAPTYVTLRPGDTAVAIGRTYQQSAIVLDRGGNDLNLSSQLAFSSANPAITISASGQVTGAAYGRAGIDVHYQQLTETAMVSVVPPGQFATILTPNGVPEPSVTLLGTDGSGPTRYLTGVMAAQPVWSPDATRIYYAGTTTGSPQTQRIYSLTISDGKSSPLIADTVSALNGAKLSSPAMSRDGAWVYFTIPASYDGHTFTDGEVWRSHADGTGLTRLVSGPVSGSPFAARLSPTPSPDGTRLAYVEKTSTANDIQILNLATGNTFTIHGLGPDELRWSPTADRLATKGQVGLYVVNADGTGVTQLAADISSFTGLDWSPDGQWIVANLWGLPTIVNPTTNLQLPLDFRGEGQSWISR